MKSFKALLYLHLYSNDDVAERHLSIEAQEKFLRQYCHDKRIEIVGTFREISPLPALERPEFSKLISLVENGEDVAEMILVTDWGKLMRNAAELVSLLRKMDSIRIYAVAINKSNT